MPKRKRKAVVTMLDSGPKAKHMPWRSGNFGRGSAKQDAAKPDSATNCDFRGWLLRQYADGYLSAKRTCEGAYNCGDSAERLRVSDIARDPKSQSGLFAKFLEAKLGIDRFVKKYVLWERIPQHDGRHGRRLLPHPFLLPHRQGEEFFDQGLQVPNWILDLPMNNKFNVLQEEGPLPLMRFCVAGVDAGGTSRKQEKMCFDILFTVN